jgi:hypothetical protein
MFSEKEVFEMFNSLFRFDDYKNGYVTSDMAKKHLEKNGIIRPKKEQEHEDYYKKFTLINLKQNELEKNDEHEQL